MAALVATESPSGSTDSTFGGSDGVEESGLWGL
jgi:hypothetical protein